MTLPCGTAAIADSPEFVDRSLRPVADDKELSFDVEVTGANVPPTVETDEQRLQQILKNLLSNAFKFTHEGGIALRISVAEEEQFARDSLAQAATVVAFSAVDTGIGIPHD